MTFFLFSLCFVISSALPIIDLLEVAGVPVPAGLAFTSCTRSKAWCPAGSTNPGEKYRTADGALCCKTVAPTPTPTTFKPTTATPTAVPTRDPRIPTGYDSCSRSKAWCPTGACASRSPHRRHCAAQPAPCEGRLSLTLSPDKPPGHSPFDYTRRPSLAVTTAMPRSRSLPVSLSLAVCHLPSLLGGRVGVRVWAWGARSSIEGVARLQAL